jgi:hypothetical protein
LLQCIWSETGGITEAGSGLARRILIEAALAYRHPARVGLTKQAEGGGKIPEQRCCVREIVSVADLVDSRAPTRRVAFAEDIVRIANQ